MNRRERRAQKHPTKAELNCIGSLIETAGCSRCGMRFGTAMPYLVARTKAGWVGRCLQPECNADFLPDTPVFLGTGIFDNDPWAEDDRDWFRAHPDRTWRLRHPVPGEIETMAADEHLAEQAQAFAGAADRARTALQRRDEGATIVIAVHQFEPGKRLRTPFEFISPDPPESYTDAAIPVLAPFLVKIAQNHRAAFQSVATQDAVDALKRRRLEATAKIVQQGDTSTPRKANLT